MTDRGQIRRVDYPSTETIYQDYINMITAQNRHISQMLHHFQTTEVTMRRMLHAPPRPLPITTTVLPDAEPDPAPVTRPEPGRTEAVLRDFPRWETIFTRPNLERFLASSPVPVVPTREQVANASQVCLFEDIHEPINSICPITQQPFSLRDPVMRLTHCGHIFNVTSINEWFSRHVRCPVCRHDIRETNPPPRTTPQPTTEDETVNDAVDITEEHDEEVDDDPTQNRQEAEDDSAELGREIGAELERNLLATLADTLNQELSRSMNQPNEANLSSAGVTQRTLESDGSGNIQYSFRFGGNRAQDQEP